MIKDSCMSLDLDLNYDIKIIDYSSEIEGFDANNVINSNYSTIWLSEHNLTGIHWICFLLQQKQQNYPKIQKYKRFTGENEDNEDKGEEGEKEECYLNTIGWGCSQPYSTNPENVMTFYYKCILMLGLVYLSNLSRNNKE